MYSVRTESRSSEEHLIALKQRLRAHRPSVLVIDPISALGKTGGHVAAIHASLRLLDAARSEGITVLCTSLGSGENAFTETTETQISTIADTWIHLAYVVLGGERNRTLTVVKSRGMKHSNQVRELILSDRGVTLADVYTAGGEVLVGTARWEREAQVREQEAHRALETARRRRDLDLAEAEIQARLQVLQAELEASRTERGLLDQDSAKAERTAQEGYELLRRRRRGDVDRSTASVGGDVSRG
jgi:circadian clock protein KaiC